MKSVITITKLSRRLSSIFLVMVTLAAGTFAQALLVCDAHISTSGNGNFGSQPMLTVAPTSIAYVKFEIASTLPAGTKADDIAKATVQFYVSKVVTPGKLDVHVVQGEWDEATISLSNAPQIGPAALTSPQIDNQTQDNYFVIDITDLV